MDDSKTAQVNRAAQLNAHIHFAEKQLERQHTELEDLLKGFTSEQAALYVSMTKAQETHWQSLGKDSH